MNSPLIRMGIVSTAFLLALSALHSRTYAQNADEKAIQDAAAAFVKAFDAGDANALAALWSDDGDYVEASGQHLRGKEAILKAYQTLFKENKGLKLQILMTDLRFPAENVAFEDGLSVVIPEKGPSETVKYSAVHVKQNGQWKLASVRESVANLPSQRSHLEPLQWLLGNWQDEGEHGATQITSAQWAMNGNFIIRNITSTHQGNLVGTGVQFIGWDQRKKQIRSWSFDSSGGFGQSNWAQNGDSWVIKSNSVLPNGDEIRETSTVKLKDADTLTWTSTDRKVNDESLPDSKTVEIKRVKPDAK